MKTAYERFVTKYVIDPETGCWRWTAAHNNAGYGMFRPGQAPGQAYKMVLAHRWSYEHFVGPIPDGLQIDHVWTRGCRFRDCVNPGHLEPVTHSQNQQRGKNGRKTVCKYGHEYTPDNTVIRANGSRTCRACGNERQRAWSRNRTQKNDGRH